VRTDVEPGESNSEADLLRRHVDALVRWNLKRYREHRASVGTTRELRWT